MNHYLITLWMLYLLFRGPKQLVFTSQELVGLISKKYSYFRDKISWGFKYQIRSDPVGLDRIWYVISDLTSDLIKYQIRSDPIESDWIWYIMSDLIQFQIRCWISNLVLSVPIIWAWKTWILKLNPRQSKQCSNSSVGRPGFVFIGSMHY